MNIQPLSNTMGLRPGLKIRKVGHLNKAISWSNLIVEDNNHQHPIETTNTNAIQIHSLENAPAQSKIEQTINISKKSKIITAQPEIQSLQSSEKNIMKKPRIDYQILKLRQNTPENGVNTVIYKIPMNPEDHNDSLENILNDLIESEQKPKLQLKYIKQQSTGINACNEDKRIHSHHYNDNGSGDTNHLDQHYNNNKTIQTIGHVHHDCRICNNSFATTLQRYEHENVAHRDSITKQFKCPHCSIQNKSIFILQSHIGRHNGFICDVCGKIFATKIYLKTHQTVHMTVSQFSCHICPKAFKDKYKLSRHLDRHTDRRPYQCNLCDKTYKDYTDLKRHKYTHGGVVPKFVCSFCGKRFFENKYLKKHTQIHLKMVTIAERNPALN